MGIDAWITSDGRAYFVRLHEFEVDTSDGSQQVCEVNSSNAIHILSQVVSGPQESSTFG